MEKEVLQWVVSQGVGVAFAFVILWIALKREREFSAMYRKDAENWVLIAQKLDANWRDTHEQLLQIVAENATALQRLVDNLEGRYTSVPIRRAAGGDAR